MYICLCNTKYFLYVTDIIYGLNLFVEGNMSTAKEIIEAVDDEAHKIVFKVIEGEILEVYSAVTLTIHIEDKGDKQLAIWTMDFKKVNASIPDPTPYLDLLCACTQDMDAHILKLA